MPLDSKGLLCLASYRLIDDEDKFTVAATDTNTSNDRRIFTHSFRTTWDISACPSGSSAASSDKTASRRFCHTNEHQAIFTSGHDDQVTANAIDENVYSVNGEDARPSAAVVFLSLLHRFCGAMLCISATMPSCGVRLSAYRPVWFNCSCQL